MSSFPKVKRVTQLPSTSKQSWQSIDSKHLATLLITYAGAISLNFGELTPRLLSTFHIHHKRLRCVQKHLSQNKWLPKHLWETPHVKMRTWNKTFVDRLTHYHCRIAPKWHWPCPCCHQSQDLQRETYLQQASRFEMLLALEDWNELNIVVITFPKKKQA